MIFTPARAFQAADCEPTADSIIIIYFDHAQFGGAQSTMVRYRENCVVAEVVNDLQQPCDLFLAKVGRQLLWLAWAARTAGGRRLRAYPQGYDIGKLLDFVRLHFELIRAWLLQCDQQPVQISKICSIAVRRSVNRIE
jgi:hypothetical protein